MSEEVESIMPELKTDAPAESSKEEIAEEAFAKVDETVESTEAAPAPADDMVDPTPAPAGEVGEDVPEQAIKSSLGDMSPQQKEEEYGKREKADGRELTIKSIDVKDVRTTAMKEGVRVKVEPETTDSGKKYYETKLVVRYEEDNLIEYYPIFKLWVNENGQVSAPSVWRDGHNTIAQMFKMIVCKMSGGKFEMERKEVNNRLCWVVKKEHQEAFNTFAGTVSDAKAFEFMIGKKVKIATSEGTYEGKEWFRNDWAFPLP